MCGGRGARLDQGSDSHCEEKPLVEVCGTTMIDRVLGALYGSRVEGIHLVTSPHAPETRTHLVSLLDGDGSRSDSVDPELADSIDSDRNSENARPAAVAVVDAPGEGYVSDLGYALDRVHPPVLTVACDLPLLAPAVIDRVLDRAEGVRGSLAVYVPAALKRQLGLSTDATWTHGRRELAPTGLNVVARARGGHETSENPERDCDRSATDTDTDTDPDTDTEAAGQPATTTDSLEDDDPKETTYVSHDVRLAVNVNRPTDLAVAEALCE